MPDLKVASDIASLIQNCLVSVAVIVGGVWTLFTFGALNMKKKAEAELADLQHRLSFKPLINISVDAEAHQAIDRDGFLISAVVRIENVGTRDTSLYFPANRRPFCARRVHARARGDVELGLIYETGLPFGDTSDDFSRGAVVRAGARVELPFVVHVPETGVYLASFSVYPTVEDREFSVSAGAESTSKITWTGRTYVLVQETTDIR